MKSAYIVTDLGFGDSGKGTTVDYLVKKTGSSLVVKFNGGPQAAHNVVQPDGRHHTFSQFGSGSFHGAETYLSDYVSVDPLAMLSEGSALSELVSMDMFRLMNVESTCPIITPHHARFNKLLETHRGNSNHGSCGVGHGISVQMMLEGCEVLRVKDFQYRGIVLDKLRDIEDSLKEYADEIGFKYYHEFDEYELSNHDILDYCMKWYESINVVRDEDRNSLLAKHDSVVFEGAQGALLDEWNGFNPHTTWSTTTRENADCIIDDYVVSRDESVDTSCIGVMRTYMTRHGVGPLISETETIQSNWINDDHNEYNDWQEHFRTGYLDLVMLRYAISISNVQHIMLTHYDKIYEDFRFVHSYEYDPDKVGSEVITNFILGEESGFVEGIYENLTQSLEYSEEVTEVLNECKPLIDRYHGNIIGFINDAIHPLKINVVSSGQTHEDKKTLIPFMSLL